MITTSSNIMNSTELDQYLAIIKVHLNESGAKINKWHEKFRLEVLLLYLIIPSRINFLQLGRYGKYSEQRYRQQFELDFDWFFFNSSLVESHFGSRLAIAFDPSYINKSGKYTPYLAVFGPAVRVKPNVVWRFQALVPWTWICTPAYIWRPFRLLPPLHWKQRIGH